MRVRTASEESARMHISDGTEGLKQNTRKTDEYE